MNSTAETASDVMLAATFGTKPKEIILECEAYYDETGLVEQFEDILGSSLYFLEVFKTLNIELREKNSLDWMVYGLIVPDNIQLQPMQFLMI